MRDMEAKTEQPCWNKENLLKLFSAMKKTSSKNVKNISYIRGMKAFKWTKVAFPPFSAKDCQRKWEEIIDKMRKRRSLTELLNEAEEIIASPFQNPNVLFLPGNPKRPFTPNILYFRENLETLSRKYPKMKHPMLIKHANKEFKALPEEERAIYVNQHNEELKMYNSKMRQYRMLYDVKKPKHKPKTTSISGDNFIGEADGMPPTPPCHGYGLFCTEQPSGRFAKGEFLKLCATRWKDLTTAEKNVYKERSKELKNEYKMKMEAYLSRFNAEEREHIVTGNNKKSLKIKKKSIIQVEKCKNVPVASDSEDEDLDYSSNDEEEERFLNLGEDEESEEDETDATYDMY